MANQHSGDKHSADKNDSSKPGFASMNEDDKRKMAQKGGEASSQDRDHLSEAGRKGGEHAHSGGTQGGHQDGQRGGNQGGR